MHTSFQISRVRNGYVVDASSRSQMTMSQDIFVFNSLETLTAWLNENFKITSTESESPYETSN